MKDKLQLAEIGTLVYFLEKAAFLGIGINSCLYYGKVDGYISVLLGNIIGIIFLILILKISNINKDKNINENIKNIFNNKFGNIICFTIMGFIFYFSIILFYDLINFISSEYLYKTPPLIISSIIIIPIIYLLTKDIKTLCRCSIIIFFISIMMHFFALIGLIPSFDLSNLLPFLENGINEPLKGAINYVAYSYLPLITLTIIPRNAFTKEKATDKNIILVALINGISLSIIISEVIGVLGIDLAILYQYPDYHYLRSIQIGDFIQRTESILAIQWVLCLFISITFMLYYCIKTINDLINIKKNHHIFLCFLFPVMMLIVSRIIFRNNTEFVNYTIFNFPLLAYIFLFGIPLFIYFIFKVKKKCR